MLKKDLLYVEFTTDFIEKNQSKYSLEYKAYEQFKKG